MKKRVNRSASRRVSISRPNKPAARRQTSTPSVLSSKRSNVARRGLNLSRVRQNSVRQQAVRNQSQKTTRVRPKVRPTAAPRRVMPARPAPAKVRVNKNRLGQRRAVSPTVRPVSASGRPAHRRAARPSQPVQSARGASVRQTGGGYGATPFEINVAGVHPDLSAEVTALQFALSNLQNLSSFDDVAADLQDLDTDLSHLLDLLESARDKGYRYQKDLDDLAFRTASSWQKIYTEVMADVQRSSTAMQSSLLPLNQQVPQLNSQLNNPTMAASSLRTTQTTVNNLLQNVHTTRSQIQGKYSQVRSNTYQLTSRLTIIHWVLGQLADAKFSLNEGENIVMAVKARWDKETDEDPEGILYLTNKRLVFERKEKVATKKVLFITTEKELVHEVLFGVEVSKIRSNKAQSKGLFGHQDFLQIDLAGFDQDLSLHLDGQESQDWASLIDSVRTGRIEEDLAVEGGLSFSDLSGELTQADIVEIQDEVNSLQDELLLSEPRAELERLENEVRELERDLGDLRARGYALEKDLEGDIAVLATQWDRIKGNANKTIDLQANILKEQSSKMNDLMAQVAGLSGNLHAARPIYMQLKSAIASTEAQADAALDTVYGQFEDYGAEVEGLAAHLDWVDWMLDAISTASFQLLATESGVAATEAMFAFPGMEPENGILFLTDQRLLWEDRVGDYELKVNEAAALIESVSVESDEVDGEVDETLVLNFGGGAALHEARFNLSAPVGEEWQQMVGRVKNGDYTKNRAIEIDPAELERIKNAPTQCPNCGAQFTAPILRGQTEIICEFCSVTTRL